MEAKLVGDILITISDIEQYMYNHLPAVLSLEGRLAYEYIQEALEELFRIGASDITGSIKEFEIKCMNNGHYFLPVIMAHIDEYEVLGERLVDYVLDFEIPEVVFHYMEDDITDMR